MTDEATPITCDVTNVLPTLPTPALQPFHMPNGDGLMYAIREGWSVEHKPGPRRQQRLHVFDDLRSFADWLNRHAIDRTRCEILVADRVVVASPEPSRHTADQVQCKLAYDPSFEAWLGAFKAKTLAQRTLHSLVRARSGDLTHEIGAMILHALRTLTITKGGERKHHLTEQGHYALNSVMQSTTFSAQVPSAFTVTCPVFEGVERRAQPVGQPSYWTPAVYSVDVMLSMYEDDRGEVAFDLEAPGLPAVLRLARREAAAYLQHLLVDDFLVGLGEFKLQEVAAYTGVLSEVLEVHTDPATTASRALGADESGFAGEAS